MQPGCLLYQTGKRSLHLGRFYSFQDGFGGIFHFGSRQELHSTRVQHEDVETAVQQKGEAASWSQNGKNHSWHWEFAHLQQEIQCVICVQELEILHRATDQNMERLGRRIEVGSHFLLRRRRRKVTSLWWGPHVRSTSLGYWHGSCVSQKLQKVIADSLLKLRHHHQWYQRLTKGKRMRRLMTTATRLDVKPRFQLRKIVVKR